MFGETADDQAPSHRLFIGGLFSNVSTNDIRERFISFGKVDDIQIIQRKDESGNVLKTFCYMDIHASPGNINKCISLYSRTKWKGNEIKVQIAKENYLKRLEKERENVCLNEASGISSPERSPKSYDDIKAKVTKMKVIVPGTKIMEEPNWIIGKYGRPLPIVRLRHRNTKFIRFDPSKHCHQLKKFANDVVEKEARVSDLSWSLGGLEHKDASKESPRKSKRRKNDAKLTSVDAATCNDCAPFDKGNGDLKKEIENGSSVNLEVDESPIRRKKSRKELSTDIRKLSEIFDVDKSSESLQAVENVSFNLPGKHCGERMESDAETEGVSSDKLAIRPSTEEKREFSSLSNSNLLVGEKDGLDNNILGESIVSQIAKRRMISNNSSGSLFFNQSVENGILVDDDLIKEKGNLRANFVADKYDDQLGIDGLMQGKNLPSGSGSSDSESNDITSSEENFSEIEESSTNNDISVSNQQHLRREESSSNEFSVSKNLFVAGKKAIYEEKENAGSDFATSESDSSSCEDSEDSIKKQRCSTSKEPSNDFDDISRGQHQLQSTNMINVEGIKEIRSNEKKQAAEYNKKKISEDKRLKSLQERKEKEIGQRNLIKCALKPENLLSENSKHIQFDSSNEDIGGSENENKSKEETKDYQKVVGSTALSWLGLDESEDSDVEDGSRFEIKKQFEGSKGAELFKLHKKVALDDRFKIDERFQESDSEGEYCNDNVADSKGDGADDDLKEEKSRVLSILDNLLGKRYKVTEGTSKKTPKHKILDDVIRYDPLNEVHTQYEAVEKSIESDGGDEENYKEEKNFETPFPGVAKDTFYDVSTNLKDLFGAKETQAFSFLNEDTKSNSPTKENVIGEAENIKTGKNSTFLKPFDDESSEESDGNDEVDQTENASKLVLRNDQRFFFTKDDPRLSNEAVDGPSAFMRNEPLDVLYRKLEASRERLRQDYKRKHKDAVRRLKKKRNSKNV